jgi:hypothetical protein
MVLRAAVFAMGGAAVLAAAIALVFGAGAGEPRIDDLGAQLVLGGATISAAVGIAIVGRSWQPPPTDQAMAASLFTLTLRRVVVAATVLPVGMLLSWTSGDETWIIFGGGATLLLMAVAGPTRDRIEKWQAEVDEAGVDVSVLGALSRRYH